MNVCAVTCTGSRPELFALTRRWLLRQTRPADRWLVVVDDGSFVEAPEAEVVHIDPMPPTFAPRSPYRVQSWALFNALTRVPSGMAAVVFEDDDWYCPTHIEQLVRNLDGVRWSWGQQHLGWTLPAASFWDGEQPHPSEGDVGLHPDWVVPYAHALTDRSMSTWPRERSYPGCTRVNIRGAGFGLPGRRGRTGRHNPSSRKVLKQTADPDYVRFRMRLGKDADCYLNLLKCSKP